MATPLLLAAGELIRCMVKPLAESETNKRTSAARLRRCFHEALYIMGD